MQAPVGVSAGALAGSELGFEGMEGRQGGSGTEVITPQLLAATAAGSAELSSKAVGAAAPPPAFEWVKDEVRAGEGRDRSGLVALA